MFPIQRDTVSVALEAIIALQGRKRGAGCRAATAGSPHDDAEGRSDPLFTQRREEGPGSVAEHRFLTCIPCRRRLNRAAFRHVALYSDCADEALHTSGAAWNRFLACPRNSLFSPACVCRCAPAARSSSAGPSRLPTAVKYCNASLPVRRAVSLHFACMSCSGGSPFLCLSENLHWQ